MATVVPGMTDSVLLRALQSRKLNAADQLFAVSDYDIVNELHPALLRIKQLLNEANYVGNQNDQQIVELVLSRITAAIRETNFIEVCCPVLIDLLEMCLNHWMTIVHGSQIQDSPHCKIVLEILSALFLNYNKPSVMTLAVPTSFAIIERTDSESLINSTASYLSLAAIHNGKILAQYAIQLIKNILKGRHSLIALLPHVYPFNSQPFNAHTAQLLKLLYNTSTKIAEKLSLLHFARMVSHEAPDLIIPHLSEFDEFLLNSSTCAAILQIFLSLINNGRVACITGQLIPIRRAAQKSNCSQHNLLKMVQIVASIARHNEQMRVVAVDDIVCIYCQKLSGQNLLNALKEVEDIAELSPNVVQPHLLNIQRIAEQHPIAYATFMRIRSITSEVPTHELVNNPYNVANYVDSVESLTSKRSSHVFPSDPAPFNQLNDQNNQLPPERSIGELDRNMKNLADRMRSTGSLGQPKRSRSFLSLTAPLVNRMICNDEVCKNCSKPGNQTTPRISSEIRTNSTNRHSLITSGNPFIRPQLPIVAKAADKTPLPPLPTQIQLGRDGRVRPIVQRLQNTNWVVETSEPNSITTTTFPVFAAKRNTLSGSQVRMVDEHSAKFRQHSGDTLVGRTSRANSEQIPNTSNSMQVRDDVVRQFVEHRRSKIRRYIYDFNAQYPIPVKCTIEGSKGGKGRMKIYFACQCFGPHCMFRNVDDLFAFKTKLPELWLHLMFLHVQIAHMHLTGGQVLDQSSVEFQTLANCWSFLPVSITKSRKFSNLVVSQFPAQKEKSRILKELQETRFFDSFTFDARKNKWCCFTCANPDRVRNLIQTGNNAVLLEGQLKQKRPRFWFLNRWNNKYFQLSAGTLTCTTNTHQSYDSHTYNGRHRQTPIDLQSVRSLSRGRKNRKALASTFEIETLNGKYVLKASDRSKAEEWFQYLQVAVAKAKQQKQQPQLVSS